jgi:hypothetical protein
MTFALPGHREALAGRAADDGAGLADLQAEVGEDLLPGQGADVAEVELLAGRLVGGRGLVHLVEVVVGVVLAAPRCAACGDPSAAG